MSQNFLLPQPTFTLESLVAQGQWSAAQSVPKRKLAIRAAAEKRIGEETERQVPVAGRATR